MADPLFENDTARLLAESAPGDNAAPLSVGELSGNLKRMVEREFGHVRVRGEISGYKRAASGHVYLTLKDADAVIDGVMWRGNAGRLAFTAQDGVEVIATGKVTTYPGRSKYQIVIETMEVAGEGALMALLEKNKARFEAEGLFAKGKARAPLPYLPRVIGVVTSPTGAVIRDILHRLEDRFPSHVIVWPVPVQGDGAAAQIAAAIGGFDALAPAGPIARPDLLIVARGGGSIEDLWAFNEEAVVRAIAGCSIPIISAVGHETDTTLGDHAADLRAPTPTAAAEIAVPVRADLDYTLKTLGARSERCAIRYRERGAERLAALVRVMPRRDALLGPQRQRVDDAAQRLGRALERRADTARRALGRVAGALRPAALDARLAAARQRLADMERLLTAAHPERPLARGYAWVEARDTGKVAASAADARAAGALRLHFRDGQVEATVGDAPAPRPKVERKPPRPYSPAKPEQGDLF